MTAWCSRGASSSSAARHASSQPSVVSTSPTVIRAFGPKGGGDQCARISATCMWVWAVGGVEAKVQQTLTNFRDSYTLPGRADMHERALQSYCPITLPTTISITLSMQMNGFKEEHVGTLITYVGALEGLGGGRGASGGCCPPGGFSSESIEDRTESNNLTDSC
eukprot:1146093-Pelagomonas_calceolata.AAC.2